MKKLYIQPTSHVVVVRLMGSVMYDTDYIPIAGSPFGAGDLGSREFNNRFEDTDEDWDWEDNSK